MLAPALLAALVSTPVDPVVCGRAEQHGDIRLVHVWGTPAEMGYAHGWLAGEDFAIAMQEFFAQVPSGAAPLVEMMRSWADLIQLTDNHRAEITAFHAGMLDRVGEDRLYLPSVERPLDELDLLVWNGYDMFRAVGCSGFAAWDARTEGGGPVIGRTLDLAVFSPHWVASQVLLVRHPGQHPGDGVPTAAVTPVGLTGVMTGVNAHGVCGFLHDGDGPTQAAVLEPERPAMFAIRDLLSRATAGTAQTVAAEELAAQGSFPFSYMIRVAGPRHRAGPPAVTWHLNAEGAAPATAGDGLTITTNHTTDRGDAPPQLSADDSCRRYGRLYGHCHTPPAPLDAAAAWDALTAVGQDHRSFLTLHAIVVEPEARRCHVGVAYRDDRGRLRPATTRPPTTLSFETLFADPRPGQPISTFDDGPIVIPAGGHEVDPRPAQPVVTSHVDLNTLVPVGVPFESIE